MARIFLLRVGTELDFASVNLQVRELGYASDSEKLYLGTKSGNKYVPTEDAVISKIREEVSNIDSAYDIWIKAGNTGTEQEFLDSLEGTDGADGKTAYSTWIDLGNTGTEQSFIDSLSGEDGEDGDNGKSAYQLWLDLGNIGTEQAFIDSLGGNAGISFDVKAVSAQTYSSVPIEDVWHFYVGAFDYIGECMIKIDMLSFQNVSMKYIPGEGEGEGSTEFDAYRAPLCFNLDLFIQGGLTTPSTSEGIAATSIEVPAIYYYDNSKDRAKYTYYIGTDGKLNIYIEASLSRNPEYSKAILSIYDPISTNSGITDVGVFSDDGYE